MIYNSKDHREIIAAEFIKSLEEKGQNWNIGWSNAVPHNCISNTVYNGVNRFHLQMESARKGYQDPRWCTFLQAKENKWKIKPGTKGTKIEYWFPYDLVKKKPISWEEYSETVKKDWRALDKFTVRAKYYTVFNAECIEGIEPLKEREPLQIDDVVSKLSSKMNVPIIQGALSAYYIPSEDKIHIPSSQSFNTEYDMNSTILHELGHATGHQSRLNRNMTGNFGSKDYAYEELVAEITSSFMGCHLKENLTKDEKFLDNHKAYINSWIEVISKDPNVLKDAIRDANMATNYMEYELGLTNKKTYKALNNEIIREKWAEQQAEKENEPKKSKMQNNKETTKDKKPSTAELMRKKMQERKQERKGVER